MAKKAELLEQAKELGLEVTEKNTVAEITAAISESEEGRAKSEIDSELSQSAEALAKAETKNTTEGSQNGDNQEVHKDTDQADQEREVSSDEQSEEGRAESEESATAKATADEQGPENEEETAGNEPKVAKAGKRSAKALAEAEEKAAKEERKASGATDEPPKPKHIQKTRSRLERAGKKFREAAKQVEKGKEYSTKQALELACNTSTTKFDATVEMHIRLNVDPKQADQNIRENIVLPAGTGKTIRVAVFGEPDDVAVAKKAGADIAAADEFLEQLDKGSLDFDVLVATPAVMVKLGKYARVLGPKGLMPNPKSGTVTKDVAKAVEQAKAGKVEARVDEAGIIHLGIGKVSFGPDKLLQNAQAVFAAVKNAKPSSIKGTFVTSIYTTTTMSPSIKVAASEL